MQQRGNTRNSTVIAASPERLYRAFTDPVALAVFLAPGDMTEKVHSFDGRPGGGYEILRIERHENIRGVRVGPPPGERYRPGEGRLLPFPRLG